MDESQYLEEINALNGKPIETFQKFGLPITIIDDVELLKRGNSRKFLYHGKEVFSPEVVSVLHFERQGFKACWSEGIAVDLINMAVSRYVAKGYENLIRYTGIKPEKLREAEIALEQRLQQERDSPAWARYASEREQPQPQSKIRKIDPQPLTVLNITNLDSSDAREKSMIEDGTGIYPYIWSYRDNIEWIEKSLNQLVSIKIDCSAQEIHRIALERLANIKSDSRVLTDYLKLPEVIGKKQYEFYAKFYKQYALDFAQKIINHFQPENLIGFIEDIGVKNWDLIVLGKEPGQYRLVEVKLNDMLTMNQRRMLAEALSKGEVVELCVVRPKTKLVSNDA